MLVTYTAFGKYLVIISTQEYQIVFFLLLLFSENRYRLTNPPVEAVAAQHLEILFFVVFSENLNKLKVTRACVTVLPAILKLTL